MKSDPKSILKRLRRRIRKGPGGGRLDAFSQGYDRALSNMTALIDHELAMLPEETEELENLVAWKKGACAVFSEWDRVWEAAGRPGTIGQSKAEAVLDYILTHKPKE